MFHSPIAGGDGNREFFIGAAAVVERRLTIDHIGHHGDGVAPTAGPIYVPYALPGETVEIEPWPGHPDRGHLLRVETASAERIAPVCPHFGVCGGCALQHWQTARYRAWKRDLVVDALRQAGIAAPVDDLVDAHGAGRRRVVLHARGGTHDVLEVGFAARQAHHIVPIDRCPILAPGLAGVIEAAWAMAEALRPAGKPLDIQATATDAGIDVDIRGSGPLDPQISLALAGIAETHRLARVTRHGELVAQRAPPTVQMGRGAVALPPGAFLQATEAGEATLARAGARPCRRVEGGRRSLCRRRAVRAAARRARPRPRRRRRRGRHRGADPRRRRATGLKPIRASGATCSAVRCAGGTARDRRGGVRSAAPGRAGAGPRARDERGATIIAVSCNAATFARDAAS